MLLQEDLQFLFGEGVALREASHLCSTLQGEATLVRAE